MGQFSAALARGSVFLGAFCVCRGVLAFGAAAMAQTFTPRDENPEDYPAGPAATTPSMPAPPATASSWSPSKGMNRRQWDDSLNWMTERHNMPKLEGKERETVLNYLEATFPPRTPAGRQNPFLNR